MNLFETETELQSVEGTIKRIIYNQNDYMIGIIENANGEEITFKGNIFGVEKQEEIIFKGQWTEHIRYGKQFEVIKWERPIPKTKEKIIAYLASPFVKGCGEKQATLIVNALGEDTVEIIMKDGEKALIGIKGIGKKKACCITESVRATFELQNIIAELSNYGISPNLIIKLYKKYGVETVKIIKKNPYILTEIKGVSFPKADEIAKRIGISPVSAFRISACVDYVLRERCYSFGHCFIKENELIEDALQLLNQNTAINEQVTEDDIIQSIYNLEDKSIMIEQDNVYPKELYTYEKRLAEKINYILGSKQKYINDKNLDASIKEYQLKNQIILGEEQKQAIKTVMNNNLTVLTGSAGTGKTTVVKAIIAIYKKFFPKNLISLSAPTGRASRKLEETTDHFAQTNHRLLGFRQNSASGEYAGFNYNEENKLNHDFFIIDEMSMVDLYMTFALFRAMENKSKVLLIGDVNQLPSISAGNVLKDLLESESVPKVKLTQIYRQAENSQIITNANLVNQGKQISVDHSKGDMFFINQKQSEGVANKIIESVLRFLDLGYDISDMLVLSPMKKGNIGTIELNKRLQEILNPKDDSKKEVKHGEKTYRVGDKIMQTINRPDKGIFNGDIGIITDIGKEKIEHENGKVVEVDTIYSDFQGVKVKHHREEWTDLELGYSISIHKSQGGQAPIVIMPISTSHYKMLARNLLYTGMTRAEEKLVLIGQQQALNIAIANNKISKRNTKLKERIDIQVFERERKLM